MLDLSASLLLTLVAAQASTSPQKPAPIEESASDGPSTPSQMAEPAGARVLPSADDLDPAGRAVLETMLGQVVEGSTPEDALRVIDRTLAQVPEPTLLRGMIQFFRATPLANLNRIPEASLAIEESVRLLPGYSGPLMAAAGIYTYTDQPGRGADYLLRAAQVDPASVRTIDDYEITTLLHRLQAAGDLRRSQALGERLLSINWQGQHLSSQSALAVEAIRARLASGDVHGARALVPRLLDPAHSYAWLTLNQAEPIWSDIERWAGPKLEKQWALYLREANARWSASRSTDTMLDYSAALSQAQHYRTLIREVLPLFDAPDATSDYDLIFVVSRLADALARQGRWSDVDALFARAQKVWPLDEQANALNITSNRAVYLFRAGRTADGLQIMDEALAAAPRWGAEVNSDALAAMHWHRACVLHLAGRTKEAATSVSAALAVARPSVRAGLQLCMKDQERAREILLDALDSESHRESVIAYLQPGDRSIPGSRYSETLYAHREAMRSDPKLLGAASRFGRVLSFRIADGAPPEAP